MKTSGGAVKKNLALNVFIENLVLIEPSGIVWLWSMLFGDKVSCCVSRKGILISDSQKDY